MSMFSESVTQVGTQVQRVIEDNLLPDAVKTGLIKALFKNGEIVDHILGGLTNSIGNKADKMFEYGRDHYLHGLPSGQFKAAAQGRSVVQRILNEIEGTETAIEYCNVGTPNILHMGWMKIIATQDYDPDTNKLGKLSAEKHYNVWLEDLIITVYSNTTHQPKRGEVAQWGPSPTAGKTDRRMAYTGANSLIPKFTEIHYDESAEANYVQMVAVWEKPYGTETFQEILNIPVGEGYELDKDYYQVRYTVDGKVKYWMYEVGSEGYPELDAVFLTPPEVHGTFFPFTYFRYNKMSTNWNKSGDFYTTSKKLLSYIGMDFDQVADGINQNPDIADVEQAMLIMAVPANTTDPTEQRYLFDFFSNLWEASDQNLSSDSQIAIMQSATGNYENTRSMVMIRDRLFKMALANGGIYKRRRPGSIGPVGSYNSGTNTKRDPFTYYNIMNGNLDYSDYLTDMHWFRHQVSAGFYDEVTVIDLQTIFYIWQGYGTVGDDDDKILLIPIDRSVTQNYPLAVRERLYARSLHYVFNSRQTIKLKWYQTDFFQFIMLAAAVVVTVVSMGTDGGSALGAAIAAGDIAAIGTAALAFAVTVLEGILISAALKLLVKALGGELALILAVVAAAFGAYQALDAGSIAGAPWAQELLSLANGLTQAITADLKDQMAGLAGEANDFALFMEKQTETLEKAKSLLEDKNKWLSPFVIFGESPTDYFNRTVHSGNIGVIGIDAIPNYVDVALTLPKLNDTLGDTFYA